MNPADLPPLVHCAERLLAEVTAIVKTFSRDNRHDYGGELKRRAMALASLATRTWRDIPRQRRLTDLLVREMDDFHIHLRLGKKAQAFVSFPQFEQLARTAEELGRQIGGWKKKQHLKGQNPAPMQDQAPERAMTLSTPTAHEPQMSLLGPNP